jgi:7-cyano-7-deazaguanine synthase in queuosine biosynthesis
MSNADQSGLRELPSLRVEVLEPGKKQRKGWLRCEIGTNVEFNTEKMQSYFFAEWKPVLYDALLVAAAVEFCDRSQRRPATGWGRTFELRIPVHQPERWGQRDVANALHSVLEFLTGDRWQISFYSRRRKETAPLQGQFSLGNDKVAVLPFSEGLDSRAVAGLLSRKLGDKLVRVRLGSKGFLGSGLPKGREPFTSVPYKVRPGEKAFAETSARSRGFKFALLSGLAAYLSKAERVIVPESGQGALGPWLVTVGQAYSDYRSHPLFTNRMEAFLWTLLNYRITYELPQLWQTKGETLARFVEECQEGSSTWMSTWSCWQDNRTVSVDRRKRQCGICAACMLRRLSVHAAGLKEKKTVYVWEDLTASAFESGAADDFDRKKITNAMRQYAIAGTLHLDHLATVHESASNALAFDLGVSQLSQACSLEEDETRMRLGRMLRQHALEWKSFVGSLGRRSFVSHWVGSVP